MKKAVALLFLLFVSCLAVAILAIYERGSGRARHTADSDTPSQEGVSESRVPRLAPAARNLRAEEIHCIPAAPSVVEADQKPASAEPLTTTKDWASAQESAFLADAPPTASSEKQQAALVAALDGYRAKGARLSAVDCRATRCKIELELRDEAADDLVGGNLLSSLTSEGVDVSNLGMAAIRDVLPDDSRRLTAYLYQAQAENRLTP